MEGRKDGRWMFYRLADSGVDPLAREALEWIGATLQSDVELEKDRENLLAILSADLEVLCKRQRKK